VNKFRKITASKQKNTRIILWLRNDLRVTDNYALTWAVQKARKQHGTGSVEIIPVFCFDPRLYHLEQSKSKFSSRKTGLMRSQFQLETIECLRKDLKSIGSNLIVSIEKPEKYLCKLLSDVYHNIIV